MNDLAKFLVDEKKKEFSEQNKLLEALRKTRAARPLEPPLEIPRHLQNTIVITDADITRKQRRVVDDDE